MSKRVFLSVMVLLAGACADRALSERSTSQGYIESGCKSLGEISVCRSGDVARLKVRSDYTRFLDGFLAEDRTYYELSRTGDTYRLTLGNPGVSDNPMHTMYTVEFILRGNGELIRLKDEGDLFCGGKALRYSTEIDLRGKTLTYEVHPDQDGAAPRRVVLQMPATDVRDDLSYDDHLTMLAKVTPSPEQQMCALAAG